MFHEGIALHENLVDILDSKPCSSCIAIPSWDM